MKAPKKQCDKCGAFKQKLWLYKGKFCCFRCYQYENKHWFDGFGYFHNKNENRIR